MGDKKTPKSALNAAIPRFLPRFDKRICLRKQRDIIVLAGKNPAGGEKVDRESRKKICGRIQATKHWLTRAEKHFGQDASVRGEMDLLLAEAELRSTREKVAARQKPFPFGSNMDWLWAWPSASWLVAWAVRGCFGRDAAVQPAAVVMPPAAIAPLAAPSPQPPVIQAAPAKKRGGSSSGGSRATRESRAGGEQQAISRLYGIRLYHRMK